MSKGALLVAGGGTAAVGLGLSGWWELAVAAVFAVTAVTLIGGALRTLLATKFGVEKSFQAVLHAAWWVPIGMLWVGFVLAGGHRFWLPGQILAAFAGDRTQLVIILIKAGGTLIGGTWLPLWTMSKGSRL